MIFVLVLPVSTVDEMVQADMSQLEAWLLGLWKCHTPQKFQIVSIFQQRCGSIFYKFVALRGLYSLLNVQLKSKYK